MYQHGDSVHAAVLHVPLLHSLPPERHRRRLAIPRRQGDLSWVRTSVPDPEPHVFGPPRSGSISQRYLPKDPDPSLIKKE